MERLTIRNSDGTYSQPTHTTFEKMFYKLAEVEDFLEETGISDFAELKHILTSNVVWQENQAHQDRWQKLKEYLKECCIPCQYWSQEVFNLHIQSKMQELEDGSDTNVDTK